MKPVDFFKLEKIAQVHRIMHIPYNYYSDFDYTKINMDMEWEDPLKQGKEISADDQDFGWSDNGLFYKGQRVRLYIRDQMNYGRYSRDLPKFHLTWCKTLEEMHSKGRYEKYVISTSINDLFLINWVDGTKVIDQSYEKLSVCKNCLQALNWKGYSNQDRYTKGQIFDDFSIEDFFNEYSSDNTNQFAYLPGDSDVTAPVNIYPNEWSAISKSLRTGHLYCSRCQRKFSYEARKNLHVHHRNGKKNDCRRSNLVVLCANCHQKEHPDHKILF